MEPNWSSKSRFGNTYYYLCVSNDVSDDFKTATGADNEDLAIYFLPGYGRATLLL